VLDEEMSFRAGGEAEDAARSLPSPSNLSGGGGGIDAVGEAGDADVSSPPNLSADRGGAICDGIWPGSHNVSLLSQFVSLHFAGDWSAYLQFAHWADVQSMLYPNVLVRLDSLLSLKSDLVGGVAAPEGDCGLGGLPAGAYGDLGSNMCNKTCSDSVGLPRHSTSCRILFPKGSSGHPDIRSIFSAVQARAPQGSASWVMEDEIALQAAEEAARMAGIQALRVEFAAAAQLKSATLNAATAEPMPVPQVFATAQHKSVPPEKEVTWSPQEAVCWSKTLDAEMEDIPAVPIPLAAVKRGSAFCNANKQEKLTAQLQEQEWLAAAASALALSLHNKEKVVELLPAQALATLPAATQDIGSIFAASAGKAVLPHNGNPVKSSLFYDLRTLRQDAWVRGSPVKISLPFSAANLSSGLSLFTSPTPNRPSDLNSLNYSSTPHNPLPQNEVDETQGTSMFSMSHRTALGSSGHFWFLQVGFKYMEDNDSKTTMLLGLSLLNDILPDAIDGFALHPLELDSTLPALTNNKTEDRFPGSAVLAFKYFMVKNKSNRGAQQTASSPSQPSLHRHNDEEEYRPPTALWVVIWVTGDGNVKEACEALAWDMVNLGLQVC
jgi:hypothetical protein